ncbi:hypothetical protein SAMN05216331_1628 [Porphyromonadaceae bacterium KH3R12]|nr:hypothetical protein SAMN05216331_1628 [Porphyromonadaceae bacterium KH3R12]
MMILCVLLSVLHKLFIIIQILTLWFDKKGDIIIGFIITNILFKLFIINQFIYNANSISIINQK